jgi:hypothetical protein
MVLAVAGAFVARMMCYGTRRCTRRERLEKYETRLKENTSSKRITIVDVQYGKLVSMLILTVLEMLMYMLFEERSSDAGRLVHELKVSNILVGTSTSNALTADCSLEVTVGVLLVLTQVIIVARLKVRILSGNSMEHYV